MLRRHLVECEDQESCRGCLPRRTQVGHLCGPCHRRFELMLTDAPTVHRWLTGNLGSGQGQAPEDVKISGGGDGDPAPLKVAIFDARQLLADRLAIWVDHWAEEHNLTTSVPSRHTPEADSAFLLTWLPGICRWDIIGDWWEELADCMREAHALAPWRPTVRRVGSIPCPECGECNLMIFGGETDVTCGSCGTLIPESRFGLWERIVKDEHGIGVAG